MNIADLETVTNIAESVATVIAIVVGGVWSYLLFVRKRERFPRAKIEHQVTHRFIEGNKILVSVDIIITNNSEVLLSLDSREISINQMLPPQSELYRFLTDDDMKRMEQGLQVIEWHTLVSKFEEWKKGQFEVEPGECHQFHSDFLLDASIQTILVKSYFRNIKKRGKQIGWTFVTIHDIQPLQMKGEKQCT